MDIKLNFENKTIYNENAKLFCIYNEVLYSINAKYYQSLYFYKLCTTLNKNILEKYNIYKLGLDDENLVLIFGKYNGYLMIDDKISNIMEFYNYMRFAQMACIEKNIIHKLMNDFDIIGFLYELDYNYNKCWKEDKLLLGNTEAHEFGVGKFIFKEFVGQSYDFSAKHPKIDKYELKRQIDRNMLNQNEIDELFNILFEYNCKKIIKIIAKILFISVDNSYLIIKSKKLQDILALSHKLCIYMFYGFRILYLAEMTTYLNTQKDDTFLFNIEEMMNLPQFAFNGNNPYYYSLNGSFISEDQHALSPCLMYGKRGIYDHINFIERMNIYSFECLKDLDLSKSGICGSIIPACLIKNPLEQYFTSYENYLKEYYPYNISNEDDTNNDKYYSDIDIMVQTETMEEFDIIALQHYKKISDNKSNYKLHFKKIITENKYKYKIYGLPREIEIFHVKSMLGTIAKFHIGAVRAIYTKVNDKNNILAFPSFITAAFAGLHCELRWTSCNKDPRDIYLKYFQRGFGFIMNINDFRMINVMVGDLLGIDSNDENIFYTNFNLLINPSYSGIGIHTKKNHINKIKKIKMIDDYKSVFLMHNNIIRAHTKNTRPTTLKQRLWSIHYNTRRPELIRVFIA